MRTGALAALLLLLAAPRAAGGQITLQLTSTAELSGGALRLALTVRNVGDATARALRPRLQFAEREVLGTARASLAPGQSFDSVLALPAPQLGAGRWPFRVGVDYVDDNAHPFQALQAALIAVGEPPPFGLILDGIEATPLQERGSLLVKLRNPAPRERRARVGVLTSADLEPLGAPRDVTLAPESQLDVRLPLGVRTALAGSRYAVYVLVEYDDAGAHQSLLADTLVEVRARRPRLAAPLLLASLGLLLAWAAALFLRRVRAPSPP